MEKVDPTRAFVRPQRGARVAIVGILGACLPMEGAWVPWTGPKGRYWRRRVNDGSVTLATPPESVTEETTEIEKTDNRRRTRL